MDTLKKLWPTPFKIKEKEYHFLPHPTDYLPRYMCSYRMADRYSCRNPDYRNHLLPDWSTCRDLRLGWHSFMRAEVYRLDKLINSGIGACRCLLVSASFFMRYP